MLCCAVRASVAINFPTFPQSCYAFQRLSSFCAGLMPVSHFGSCSHNKKKGPLVKDAERKARRLIHSGGSRTGVPRPVRRQELCAGGNTPKTAGQQSAMKRCTNRPMGSCSIHAHTQPATWGSPPFKRPTQLPAGRSSSVLVFAAAQLAPDLLPGAPGGSHHVAAVLPHLVYHSLRDAHKPAKPRIQLSVAQVLGPTHAAVPDWVEQVLNIWMGSGCWSIGMLQKVVRDMGGFWRPGSRQQDG